MNCVMIWVMYLFGQKHCTSLIIESYASFGCGLSQFSGCFTEFGHAVSMLIVCWFFKWVLNQHSLNWIFLIRSIGHYSELIVEETTKLVGSTPPIANWNQLASVLAAKEYFNLSTSKNFMQISIKKPIKARLRQWRLISRSCGLLSIQVYTNLFELCRDSRKTYQRPEQTAGGHFRINGHQFKRFSTFTSPMRSPSGIR